MMVILDSTCFDCYDDIWVPKCLSLKSKSFFLIVLWWNSVPVKPGLAHPLPSYLGLAEGKYLHLISLRGFGPDEVGHVTSSIEERILRFFLKTEKQFSNHPVKLPDCLQSSIESLRLISC